MCVHDGRFTYKINVAGHDVYVSGCRDEYDAFMRFTDTLCMLGKVVRYERKFDFAEEIMPDFMSILAIYKYVEDEAEA